MTHIDISAHNTGGASLLPFSFPLFKFTSYQKSLLNVILVLMGLDFRTNFQKEVKKRRIIGAIINSKKESE